MTVNKRSPGRYRHRISIYDPNTTQSASGYPVESPREIGGGDVLPAWVYGVGGSEMLRDQQIEPHITHVVELRYLPGVKQTHHVKWGTRRLNIEKLVDVDGRSRKLMLYCTELGS